MSDVLQRAADRQKALKEKLANISADIDRLRKEQDLATAELIELDTFFRVAAKYDSSPSEPKIDEATASAVFNELFGGYGSKKRTIVEFSRDAIKKHGPMPASRIVQLMDEAGIGSVVGGKDSRSRASNLSAILSRDDHFYSDREAGGYRYKETAPQDGNQEGLI